MGESVLTRPRTKKTWSPKIGGNDLELARLTNRYGMERARAVLRTRTQTAMFTCGVARVADLQTGLDTRHRTRDYFAFQWPLIVFFCAYETGQRRGRGGWTRAREHVLHIFSLLSPVSKVHDFHLCITVLSRRYAPPFET